MKKPPLGKGLGALLDGFPFASNNKTSTTDYFHPKTENGKTVVAGTVVNIPLEQISVNPFQPRTEFEKQSLLELSQSIKEYGLIQPITVRCVSPAKYQIISGERRFRASQLAGLKTIPAFVRLANDKTMLEMALVENVQREDLNPIDIALGYKRLIEECNLTQEQLSKKIGQNRSTIANFLRLLKLPDTIQIALRDKKITMGHARALLSISHPEEQTKILNEILKNELSVRKIEELARNYSMKQKPGSKSSRLPRKTNQKHPTVLSFEEQKFREDLCELFRTQVEIEKDENGKGKISIYFKNDAEMQRIQSILELD